MTQRFKIFCGVLFFGLSIICGLEGAADRIRDHSNLLVSEWSHAILSIGALFISAWCFSLTSVSRPNQRLEDK